MSRTGWLLAALGVAIVAWLAPAAPSSARDLTDSSFPDALLGATSLLLLMIASWTALVGLLAATGCSSTVVRAVTPRVLRRAMLAGAAGALVVAPAHADPGGSSAASSDRSVHDHTVDGLRLPDRPSGTTGPAELAPPTRTVVVRPGDTLWAIAAAHLPAGASDAQIAQQCAAWHAANRDVIGPDPDLVLPRQRLTPPLRKDPS